MNISSLQITLEKIIEAIVQRILRLEDYFCLTDRIRLSEIFLMWQSFSWFVWLMCFDVKNSSPVFTYMFSQRIWMAVFGLLSALHLVSVFLQRQRLRSAVITAYAIVWFIWLVIAAFAAHQSATIPMLFNLCILSIAVAIHLSRNIESDQPVNN